LLTKSLKVHLRVLDVHRTTLRIVTLRPQTGVRFSSNFFHDTWHILGGPDGAAILGRLLWGLAFQRHPNTLVLLDSDHLVPTPFEGDPPLPILLVPDGLTRIDIDILRALKLRLRRAPGPVTTIRWHTFGMPAALAADRKPGWWWHSHSPMTSRERMSKRAGFVCYTAPPEILRANALSIFRMSERSSGYHSLAEHGGRNWRVEGEFQVVEHFARDVSAATVARREIVGDAQQLALSDAERVEIYRRKEAVLRRS